MDNKYIWVVSCDDQMVAFFEDHNKACQYVMKYREDHKQSWWITQVWNGTYSEEGD